MNISNIKKVIKQYKPDIIHANDYKASVLTVLSGFKGRIISHLHINATFAKSWNLKSYIYYRCINSFYKVVGVSDSVCNESIFKNKMKDKYITIYNYVDVEDVVRKSNQYDYHNKYALLYFGRLNELKNPLQFIRIVYEMKKNQNDINAVMIGDGELKQDCKKLIEDLDLKKNIDMLGFIVNPFPIVKKCNICIMPSKVEGFGLSAIETLILNKPVLNSGVGGLKEIFSENQWLICKSISDYIYKINLILSGNERNISYQVIDKYTNKESWKEKIITLYE